MTRAWSAGLFFLAGVVFVVVLERASDVACNDSCPAWLSGLVMVQLLLPIIWAGVGYFARQHRRPIWFLVTVAVSIGISYCLNLQTLHYTTRAISG